MILTDGQRVRLARLGKGWTIQNLADQAGFSLSYLSMVENDKRVVPEIVRFLLDLDIQSLWYDALLSYFPNGQAWFIKDLNKALHLEGLNARTET